MKTATFFWNILLVIGCCSLFISANGQAPGGVTNGLKLWLKSNAGVSVSNGLVSGWADQSGGQFNATQTIYNKQPGYSITNSYFNGYPSLNFDITDDGMQTSCTINPLPVTMIVVYNSTSNSTAGRRAVQGSNNWLLGLYNNLDLFHANGVWVYYTNNYQSTTTPVIAIGTQSTASVANSNYVRNGRTLTPTAITASTAPGLISLGATGLAADPLGGSIAEVISYPRELTAAERNQVESYLAIKYGVSLDQGGGPVSYVSSSGATIWNATANAGYANNIFGVGRDNASGLNQSQSVSANTGRIRLSSPSSLSNGDYLILSDNNGTIGPVAQSGLPGGATHASGLAWNVNKTGVVGTIDITLASILPNTMLLVDNNNDGTFEAAIAPTSISSTSLIFAGISLNDQAKLKVGYVLSPVAPGGVSSGLKLWLDAANARPDGSGVSSWLDISGSGNDAVQGTKTQQPGITAVNGLFNGNSSVDFGITAGGMATPLNITTPPYTTIVVYNSTSTSAVGRRAMQGTSNWLIGPWGNNARFFAGAFIEVGNLTPTSAPNISLGTASIAATNNALFYYNGKNASANTGGVTGTTTPGVIGLGTSGQNYEPLGGSIAEAIVYNTVLSAAERNKVETYLSIKYGISLDQTVATNYTRPNGVIVWANAANSGYTYNIFGIGRDTLSGLRQLQSVSENTNRIAISNSTNLLDGDYLILSDNNASMTATAQGGLPGGCTSATPLAWSVSKTGTVGTYTLTILSPVNGARLLADIDNKWHV